MSWLTDEALALTALRRACAVEADDEEAVDALAEETEFKDAIAWALRKMLDADMMAGAAYQEAERLEKRAKRYEERGRRIKGAILAAMEMAGARKLEMPAATVTVRAGPVSVHVSDIDALPEPMRRVKMSVEPDKQAIKAALEAGQEIPGALLSNGMPVLQVKV